MTAILQTDSWVETESCDGPRRTRNSPSRENPGILMTELQDKYITEFELPFRNLDRYIKEIGNNWNRLDNQQKEVIKHSFNKMGLGSIEKFGNESSSDESITNQDKITNFINFLSTDPKHNTKLFMDNVWKKPATEANKLHNIRDSMYEWSIENTQTFHANWRSGLLLFFFLLIIMILIIVAITANTSGSGSTGSGSQTTTFGRSIFPRR